MILNKINIYLFLLILNFSYFFSGFLNTGVCDNLWNIQSSNTTHILNRLFFSDTLNGWATGDSGIIIHTTNGGLNWNMQTTNTLNFVYDIRFLNSNTGWAVASDIFNYPDPVLLKTTNGGLSWVSHAFADTTLLLFTVCFINELTGWVGGYHGSVLKTTDGGSGWILQNYDTSQYRYNSINRIKFYNGSRGSACGGTIDLAGIIWNLTNSGNNWFAQGVAAEPLYDIYYLDSNNIFLTGGDFEFGLTVFNSTNSGVTWNFNPLYYFGVGKAISFRTRYEAWIPLYFSPFFAVTTNNGNNWFELQTPDNSTLNDVFFVDSLHGWAAGNGGALYKYNNSLIGIIENRKPAGSWFTVSTNYPNPFNSSTEITVRIFKQAFVKMTVYDCLGNEIEILANGIYNTGSYKFLFDGSRLSSGIYFCKTEINNNRYINKMVLIK